MTHKPPPGRYRLQSDPQPPANPVGPSMMITVDETGADTSFGRFDWHGAPDNVFRHPGVDIVIECHGNNTFDAIENAGTPQEKVYSGTCTVLP